MFCPKCGAILLPKKVSGKKVMACSCGHINRTIEGATITEEAQLSREVEIVDQPDVALESLPRTEAECPKCGHNEARYWTMQTRAGDEAETKFLKCEKCKHTWRDYS